MKLYFCPDTCALLPLIVLLECDSQFTLELVDLRTHTTRAGANFYDLNPKGQVPLLQLENGEYLSEGPVIAQYVADLAQNTSIMPPAGSMARYRVMEWQNHLSAELHKAFAPLFRPTTDEQTRGGILEVLDAKFSWLSDQLRHASFLTGATFTAADAYLFTIAQWTTFVGLDIEKHRHLAGFLDRCLHRPAVQAALKMEAGLRDAP